MPGPSSSRLKAAAGADLPQFVKGEFDAFLVCGMLAYGFLRLRCGDCGHKLVAFSCKRRGSCPSWGGSTYMADDEADLYEARKPMPLQTAACTYRIAFCPRAGQAVLTLQGAMPREMDFTQSLCADINGLSQHAAVALMKGYAGPDALADIQTSVVALRARPEVAGSPSGKVGSIGYCMGGRLAYLAAATAGVDAAVAYCGGAHHGFNCWARGSYHAPSAALGHGRSLGFLAQHLMR